MLKRWGTLILALALVGLMTSPASAGDHLGPEGDGYQTKVFVQGAEIHGANGLAVDADGRLLVASVFGGEIVVLEPRTGRMLERLGHADGVDGPDDVAVGPDGSIYWTDILLGEVGRLAPNGDVTKQFVAPGMNPIAFRDDGRLFVGQAFFGDGLYELDPDLVGPPRVVIGDSGIPPFVSQLNGFDFGPDGMLYAPQPFLERIVRIDPDSGDITQLADVPDFPTSVEFDSRGHLYASLGGGAIARVDATAGNFEIITEIRGATLDNMVFDSRDRLIVSDSDNGAIYSVSPGGGVRTIMRGGLILPGGATIMERGLNHYSLFVADLWSLAEFDAKSGRLLDVDRQSRAGGGIVESWTVAADGNNVIITSWMTNAVQIWDPAADQQVQVYTDFAVPMNAIRFMGDLVVAELGTGSVSRDNEMGSRSTIAAGLAVPIGLAATEDDLWVADWATGILWEIVADGVVLDPPRLVTSGLSFPEGLAVDGEGSLLVVEAGAGRLTRIDPSTGGAVTVVDGLGLGVEASAGAPPAGAISSVAVGPDGSIFVTGDRANVVYRIRAVPPG